MAKKIQKKQKTVILAYLDANLSVLKKKQFLKEVTKKTEVSLSTFYRKAADNSFSTLEKEAIAKMLNRPVKSLF